MNDLRLSSTIKLYNPPPVEKRRCHPRLTGSEESMTKMIKSLKSRFQRFNIKSLKSGWNI